MAAQAAAHAAAAELADAERPAREQLEKQKGATTTGCSVPVSKRRFTAVRL